MNEPLRTPDERRADMQAIREHFGHHVIFIDQVPYRSYLYFVVTHTSTEADTYQAWNVTMRSGSVQADPLGVPTRYERPKS